MYQAGISRIKIFCLMRVSKSFCLCFFFVRTWPSDIAVRQVAPGLLSLESWAQCAASAGSQSAVHYVDEPVHMMQGQDAQDVVVGRPSPSLVERPDLVE